LSTAKDSVSHARAADHHDATSRGGRQDPGIHISAVADVPL
jgi:hypothetical protein